jgi:hypothetical protein
VQSRTCNATRIIGIKHVSDVAFYTADWPLSSPRNIA